MPRELPQELGAEAGDEDISKKKDRMHVLYRAAERTRGQGHQNQVIRAGKGV